MDPRIWCAVVRAHCYINLTVGDGRLHLLSRKNPSMQFLKSTSHGDMEKPILWSSNLSDGLLIALSKLEASELYITRIPNYTELSLDCSIVAESTYSRKNAPIWIRQWASCYHISRLSRFSFIILGAWQYFARVVNQMKEVCEWSLVARLIGAATQRGFLHIVNFNLAIEHILVDAKCASQIRQNRPWSD